MGEYTRRPDDRSENLGAPPPVVGIQFSGDPASSLQYQGAQQRREPRSPRQNHGPGPQRYQQAPNQQAPQTRNQGQLGGGYPPPPADEDPGQVVVRQPPRTGISTAGFIRDDADLVVSVDRGSPALSYEATRKALRRRTVGAVGGVLFGLALLAGFVAIPRYYVDAYERLVRTGIATPGLVEYITPNSGSTSNADVSFDAAGSFHYETVDLSTDDAKFTVGQTVTVYYDPHDPSRMTIAGEVNEPDWTMAVAVGMFFAGVLLALGWGVSLYRWLRARRILKNHPWTPIQLILGTDGPRRIDAYANLPLPHMRSSSEGETLRFRCTELGPDWGDGPVWLAGPTRRHAILAKSGGQPLLRARVPRA